MWWQAPVIPATWEAEAGESLEPRRWRSQCAEITPLHSSLGDKSENFILKKKKRCLRNQNKAEDYFPTILKSLCCYYRHTTSHAFNLSAFKKI